MTRSISADRTEFFCQAEAFAFLVRNDIIGLDGGCGFQKAMVAGPCVGLFGTYFSVVSFSM